MTPRVRVVVVDYNGGELTLECLRSLVATDWPAEALEIVLVDNASPEPVTATVAEELPSVRVIESSQNRGFAGGNNAALADLNEIEYVALVNNDVTVQPEWLKPLIAELETNRTVGAVMPKVLLADRFTPLTFSSPLRCRSWLDRRLVGVRLSGARTREGTDISQRVRYGPGFGGPEWDRFGTYRFATDAASATVFVPHFPDTGVELLLSASQPTICTAQCGTEQLRLTVGPTPAWYRMPDPQAPVDLIHTVGIAFDRFGYGTDIGYLRLDDGNFDKANEIDAWSGAVVAMRLEYISDVGMFDEALFMYYEDVDLSLRGSDRGWRYRVRPDSTARHRHQAAAARSALTALYYSERNYLLIAKRRSSLIRFVSLAMRHLRITASYAVRDIVAPTLSLSRPRWEPTKTRLRALGGAVLPSALWRTTQTSPR